MRGEPHATATTGHLKGWTHPHQAPRAKTPEDASIHCLKDVGASDRSQRLGGPYLAPSDVKILISGGQFAPRYRSRADLETVDVIPAAERMRSVIRRG